MTSGHHGWYQRKRTRELALVACFLAPALAIFFLYRLLPLGWNVVLSFQAWSPLKPAQWIGLENYVEMWSYDDVFWVALRNTLIFIAASPLAIAAALGIALLVNSDLKGAAVYRTIVFLSYPLMAVAVGIIWRWMYDERGGIINYALRASGLVDRPIGFLQDFDWALPSVIFAEIWQVMVALSWPRTFALMGVIAVLTVLLVGITTRDDTRQSELRTMLEDEGEEPQGSKGRKKYYN